jgi:hypothetical protein
MTKEFFRVYPEGIELKTAERKTLYKELLEEDHFGERGKGFVRALKRLVFEGEVESYEECVEDPDALLGRRENDLGYMLGAYICLAAPLPDIAFYKEVLSRYSRDICLNMASSAAIYIDGSGVSADYLNRVGLLIEAISEVLTELGCGLEKGGSYSRMFVRFFSRVCHEGTSNNCLFPRFLRVVDSVFVDLLEEPTRNFDFCASEILPMLFGGSPANVAAYTDEQFIVFLKGYFSREYTPALLEYLDAVYYSIPEEKRIRLDGDKISYFAD